jgi:hypothetical protein
MINFLAAFIVDQFPFANFFYQLRGKQDTLFQQQIIHIAPILWTYYSYRGFWIQ